MTSTWTIGRRMVYHIFFFGVNRFDSVYESNRASWYVSGIKANNDNI